MQSYHRVTYENRCHISSYLQVKMPVSQIAKRLGLHRSTVYRELSRNSYREGYEADHATKKAYQRFRRCRRRKVINSAMKNKIVGLLASGWSPEQIAGRFQLEGALTISHQTIYRSLIKGRYERKLLRKFGKRGAGRVGQQRARRLGKQMISDRPSIVEQRSRLGDWERDGMYGANRQQLLVLLERKSRLIQLASMGKVTGNDITRTTLSLLQNLGKEVFTITNDNGSEFSDGKSLPYPVYYCEPMKPQQRGSVENAIGLLRQYVKRSTDLKQLSQNDLTNLENRLNYRPRKCLNYRTPHEVFYQTNVALVM